ncbi:MAG TPA: signal peptidase I [Acidimicrobiia bacterium]|nr:signal peptidase I [Acidimicrobiia bacterium]
MAAAGHWAGRVLLAGALLVLLAVGVGPLTGTYRLATVLTGSMAPGMPAGSMAVLVPIDPAAVRVGDVITYQAPLPDHRVVTHRVTEILAGGPHPVLRTKGDANATADPWTARLSGSPAWRRVGVVPWAGTAIRALRAAPVHRATVRLVPLVLLTVMLLGIWFPRLAPARRVAVVVTVAMVAAVPAALAAFTKSTSASHTVGSAPDWTAPTVSTTTIAKQTGYLAGSVKQGIAYYLYANVADNGNPASGVSTVKADLSALTATQTNVPLTSGSYSVNGVSYNYRSGALTSANPLAAGSKSYSITSTDVLGYSGTQSFSTTVDNTAPSAFDIQTTNHAGGTAGTAEIGDTISFTYSEPIDPQSILPGWTGGSTNVVVHLEDGGCLLNLLVKLCSDDSFEVYNGANPLATLGPVDLNDPDYIGGGLLGTLGDALFGATGTPSTMVRSGNSIVITLGTRSGSAVDQGGTTTMQWDPPTTPYDAAGNALDGVARNEQGGSDREF